MSDSEHTSLPEHTVLEPPYSCQYHLAKVEQITQQLQELHNTIQTNQTEAKEERKDVHAALKELNNAIKGNGKEGLVVQMDRNTNFRKTMTKLLWVLFTPLYGGLIALLFRLLFNH